MGTSSSAGTESVTEIEFCPPRAPCAYKVTRSVAAAPVFERPRRSAAAAHAARRLFAGLGDCISGPAANASALCTANDPSGLCPWPYK